MLTFTERPEPGLSSIQVLDTGGQPVERGEAGPVDGAPLQFAVGLGDLADGTYTVSWRVVSKDDGHLTAGSFAFGVGVPAPTATPQAQAAPQGATPSPSVAGHRRPPGPLRRADPAGRRGRHRPGRVRPGPPLRAPGSCWPWPPASPSPAGVVPVPGRAGPDRRPPRHPPRLLHRPGPPPPGRRGRGHRGRHLVPGRRPAPARSPRAHPDPGRARTPGPSPTRATPTRRGTPTPPSPSRDPRARRNPTLAGARSPGGGR